MYPYSAVCTGECARQLVANFRGRIFVGWGARRGAWGSPRRLYKAPTDYTKPQQAMKSPNRLYKSWEY